MNIIEKAFQFALKKHEGQYRKGTDIPYITHPFAVSMILKHYGYSDEVIAAGLLHDTLEDTDTTAEELFAFGPYVLELVQSASEFDKSLSWEERKHRTIAELTTKSPDQLAVIVADKLHNIRSIQSDIDEVGEAVWHRFNRGKRDQSWYYLSLINALSPHEKDIRLIRVLNAEAKRIFLGSGKLTDRKIDLLFASAYYLSEEVKEQLQCEDILEFALEVKESAEGLYRNGGLSLIEPLMGELQRKGIQFETNSDGPIILLTFCYELQYRLGWSTDELYRHFKRNLSKL
ncbi:HD domain-containing protein [Sporosarcina sp. FA9]|uniref:HD domain-containing protein n=1 Tax=Sporosarcina sp. FA9 TaxID=3413030 RepID=UPI003F65BEB5